ncbi:uncharacterized protein LOC113937904 isoform X2 [Zalophus californianus]|uniref:Uncharacterized protein LOC113937904 isoform X2 n=1 Tax=Zalophus californianus TaxID=9704 RepID=A0A6J2FEU9_ZALCA|nr:uncharacterized protein LOC113937904 isoform X2 [Zalophus californianus]
MEGTGMDWWERGRKERVGDDHLSRFTLEITSLFLSSTLAVSFLALVSGWKGLSFCCFYCACNGYTVNDLIPNLKSLKKCDLENPKLAGAWRIEPLAGWNVGIEDTRAWILSSLELNGTGLECHSELCDREEWKYHVGDLRAHHTSQVKWDSRALQEGQPRFFDSTLNKEAPGKRRHVCSDFQHH